MTLQEYDDLKKKLTFIGMQVSYNIGQLDARWLERKMNNEDITYVRDIENLINIYEGYAKMSNIIKKYIS